MRRQEEKRRIDGALRVILWLLTILLMPGGILLAAGWWLHQHQGMNVRSQSREVSLNNPPSARRVRFSSPTLIGKMLAWRLVREGSYGKNFIGR
jgi:hypothetical protein